MYSASAGLREINGGLRSRCEPHKVFLWPSIVMDLWRCRATLPISRGDGSPAQDRLRVDLWLPRSIPPGGDSSAVQD